MKASSLIVSDSQPFSRNIIKRSIFLWPISLATNLSNFGQCGNLPAWVTVASTRQNGSNLRPHRQMNVLCGAVLTALIVADARQLQFSWVA